MSKKRIRDKQEFIQLMEALSGEITSAFIRVTNKEEFGWVDGDLINMALNPVGIRNVYGNAQILDTGDYIYTIEMDKFQFADIEAMENEDDYGFLREPHRAIFVRFTDKKYLGFFYQLQGDRES